jgi:hypothetical protein
MTRVLHPTLAALIRPVPGDFSPTFTEINKGRAVRWSDTLTVEGYGPAEVELGYSKFGDESQEAATLRAGAWQAMELARLGRIDLLSHCLVDRHKNRPRAQRQG